LHSLNTMKNIRNFTIAFICFFFLIPPISGQNVGIGIANPNTSALLDVSSTTQGVLLPRLTTTEIGAISTPALSLIVYNTTTNCFEFYNGTTWQNIVCQCTGIPVTSAITGSAAVCAPTSGITYSVTAVAGVTYNWSVPSGATITAGQGTNSITVSFTSAVSDNVSVTPSNTCGTGATTYLPIVVSSGTPTAPVISGLSTVGASTSQPYYVSNSQANVTYTWTITGAATITTPGIYSSATFPAGAGSYTITATATNSCGTASTTLAVTANTVTHGLVIFNYTGSLQTWTVPAGVNYLWVKVWGAGGGAGTYPGHNGSASSLAYSPCGGTGGYVSGTLSVNGSTTLYIIVGGGGTSTSYYNAYPDGGYTSESPLAGGGGGRSAIEVVQGVDAVTAGGGGGGGNGFQAGSTSLYSYFGSGGGAGNGSQPNNGLNGAFCSFDFGYGATAIAGGSAGTGCGSGFAGSSGAQYQGGNANITRFSQEGGGGGGGYYGGGAGNNYLGGGGGGGSNYPTASTASFILGSDLAGNTGTQGTTYSPLTAPNNADSFYQAGIATATTNGSGGNGEIVIFY
jgi:hypothetical protein